MRSSHSILLLFWSLKAVASSIFGPVRPQREKLLPQGEMGNDAQIESIKKKRLELDSALKNGQWAIAARRSVEIQARQGLNDEDETVLDVAIRAGAPSIYLEAVRAQGFSKSAPREIMSPVVTERLTKEQALHALQQIERQLQKARGLAEEKNWKGAWEVLNQEETLKGSGYEKMFVGIDERPDWWKLPGYHQEGGVVGEVVQLANELARTAHAETSTKAPNEILSERKRRAISDSRSISLEGDPEPPYPRASSPLPYSSDRPPIAFRS